MRIEISLVNSDGAEHAYKYSLDLEDDSQLPMIVSPLLDATRYFMLTRNRPPVYTEVSHAYCRLITNPLVRTQPKPAEIPTWKG